MTTLPRTRTRYLMLATHVPASGAAGGVVRYTVALAEALARRPDVDLRVVAAGEGARYFRRFLPPGNVHRLPALPTPALSVLERLGLLPGLRRGVDVVHGTKHIVPLRMPRGTRSVLTAHDMLLFDRGSDYPLLKRLLLRSPYRGSLRTADAIVAVSDATRDRVVDHLPRVADRVRVSVLAPSENLRQAPVESLDALAGRPFALVVGDASPRKNVAMLVEHWERIRDRVPDACLVLVGPAAWGHEERGGATWTRLVDSGGGLALRGVSDGALRWCYENAAVVVCPSLIEGFGLPAAEARSFGATVLTSEDPALCQAAGPAGTPLPSWSPDAWVSAVADAMTAPRTGVPDVVRTWDDVAADTLAALWTPAPTVPPELRATRRMGVSPYTAQLRVRHVVVPGDREAAAVAERLVHAHRAQNWKSDIVGADDAGVADVRDVDVVVLHGRRAGELRERLRGGVPTVLLTRRSLRGVGVFRERRRSRWTNVLALHGRPRGWDRVVCPVTRLEPGALDPDEMAAVIARARAWGRAATRSPRGQETE